VYRWIEKKNDWRHFSQENIARSDLAGQLVNDQHGTWSTLNN